MLAVIPRGDSLAVHAYYGCIMNLSLKLFCALVMYKDFITSALVTQKFTSVGKPSSQRFALLDPISLDFN